VDNGGTGRNGVVVVTATNTWRLFGFTANVGTEGAVKKILFWDISEEFPITR
jgi:hypothetical protein